MLDKIRKLCENNKCAMFVDMDGVIADLVVDLNGDIPKNKKNYFLKKRPVNTIVKLLKELSYLKNLDLYILSACVFINQAADKDKWLEKYAPFFEKEKRIYVIKEIVKYNKDNKTIIKTRNIKNTMREKHYDMAIYLDDEISMLREAAKLLQDKIICFHPSNLID